MRWPQRYGASAPAYDLLSAEWPVYRVGRRAGVSALGLQPGDTVLDVGCGTGLTMPLLQNAVGSSGRIIGVDASADMLQEAERRAQRGGWHNVALVHSDATSIDPAVITDEIASPEGPRRADAVIFVYSLSLMDDWRDTWRRALAATRPGARVAVVDMQMPVGRAAIFSPLARLACALGGSDPEAHPWQALEAEAVDVERHSFWGGHVQLRAGAMRQLDGADVEDVGRRW